VPVLQLLGKYDSTVNDDNLAAIRTEIPDVGLRTLNGVGHIPMVEGPAGFNEAVTAFLDEITCRKEGLVSL
jgi:pimeloyl-ACP methyl ester carboxylesterase